MRSRVCGLSEVTAGLKALDTEADSPRCSTKLKSKDVLWLGAVMILLALRPLTPVTPLAHATGSGTRFLVPVGRVSTCYDALTLLRRFGETGEGCACVGSSQGRRSLNGGRAMKLFCHWAIEKLCCRHTEATRAPGRPVGIEQAVAQSIQAVPSMTAQMEASLGRTTLRAQTAQAERRWGRRES